MPSSKDTNGKLPRRRTGLARVIAATGYSFAGLKLAITSEEAFRQEFVLFLFLAPLGIWIGESNVERILLIGVLLIVLIVELLNTAVEAVVDRVSADFHELSRQAKDLGSAAVFISLSLVVTTWTLILL